MELKQSSCLYECVVRHSRLHPVRHRFTYRLFMFYLDLDEMEPLSRRLKLFGCNRPSLFSFWNSDHPAFAGNSIKVALRQYLSEKGITTELGRVTLLTLPRLFGYVFNPVSFFFCFDAEGMPLCAVAEVNNTFHETKPFLIPRKRMADGKPSPSVFRLRAPKFFYVSPFSGLEVEFDFRLRLPEENLTVFIDDYEGAKRTLTASLTGHRRDLSDATLLLYTLKSPLATLLVMARIHWQALWLYLKNIPFHRKADNPSLQREVIHPHPSTAGDRT